MTDKQKNMFYTVLLLTALLYAALLVAEHIVNDPCRVMEQLVCDYWYCI